MSSCAPCIFGAVQTSVITFPSPVATISVVPVFSLTTLTNNVTSTITTSTTILPPASEPAPGQPPVVTITFTSGQPITWTTLGATLTYPTQYVDYISFQGAAVTGTGCATNLAPTALTIPAGVPTASLIYPQDQTGALPTGLISYLSSQPGFIQQLNNDALGQCAAIGGLPAPSGGASVVTNTLTSTFPTNTILTTSTIPPPTTFAVSTQSGTTTITTTRNAAEAVTQTSVATVQSVTGLAIVISGSNTVTAAAATLDVSSAFSALASASRAPLYTNGTITPTATPPQVPASRTSSALRYTGAAAPAAPVAATMAGSWFAGLLGLVFYL